MGSSKFETLALPTIQNPFGYCVLLLHRLPLLRRLSWCRPDWIHPSRHVVSWTSEMTWMRLWRCPRESMMDTWASWLWVFDVRCTCRLVGPLFSWRQWNHHLWQTAWVCMTMFLGKWFRIDIPPLSWWIQLIFFSKNVTLRIVPLMRRRNLNMGQRTVEKKLAPYIRKRYV